MDNHNDLDIYDNSKDENKVEGVWTLANHRSFVNSSYINNSYMKAGATVPDENSKTKGMNDNPEFHGYYRRVNNAGTADNEYCNYLACYRYMIKIGNCFGKGTDYKKLERSDFPGLRKKDYDSIKKKVESLNIKSKVSTNAGRKAYMFGVDMHTATDAFVHSTFRKNSNGNWVRITHHDIVNGKDVNHADDSGYKGARFTMAKRVGRNNIYRYQGKRSDVPVCHDFHAAGDTNGTYYGSSINYRIANITKYASEVNITDKNVIKHYASINVNADPKKAYK